MVPPSTQPPEERTRRERLFFALWPGEAQRDALVDVARRVLRKGRATTRDNLHITLVFLGWVTPEQRACAEQAADEVRAPAFTLTLDRLGYFRRTQVLWSAPSEVPSEVYDLVGGLNKALMRCGFKPDARTYRAHVTLARKVPHGVAERTLPAISWPVDGFHLVESTMHRSGARYRVVGSWPLQATSGHEAARDTGGSEAGGPGGGDSREDSRTSPRRKSPRQNGGNLG